MPHVTLDVVQLFLADLLGQRSPELALTKVGAIYRPMLERKLDAISKLPPALLGKPRALELAATDTEHDDLRKAIDSNITSHLLCPLTPADVREALAQASDDLTALMPTTRASYAQEGAAAQRLRDRVESFRPALERVPVAGGTLFDWLLAFCDRGEQIGRLLAERGDEVSSSQRAEASTLRRDTSALIQRFRAALADEVAADPALPRDLESRLFGFLDSLLASRDVQSKPAPKPAS